MNTFKTFSIALTLTALLFASCDNKPTPEPDPLPDDGAYTGTVTALAGTENEFILENAKVEVIIDEAASTAEIKMLQVKFSERMPVKIDIAIPGATLIRTTGGYTVSCGTEGIVPIAMGGPYPDRTITELTGTVTAETLTLGMECGGDPMTFTGTRTAAE